MTTDFNLAIIMITHFYIPEDIQFADLQLVRDPATGDLICNLAPIEKICIASGIDFNEFLEPYGYNVTELIVTWYLQHLHAGGKPDPVQEQIFAEVEVEEAQAQAPCEVTAPTAKDSNSIEHVKETRYETHYE